MRDEDEDVDGVELGRRGKRMVLKRGEQTKGEKGERAANVIKEA
jgi:hypothetical protein